MKRKMSLLTLIVSLVAMCGVLGSSVSTTAWAAAPGTSAGWTGSYIVKAGDTLFRIAEFAGASLSDMAAANNIENVNLIYVGQNLIVPSSPAETLGEQPAQSPVATQDQQAAPANAELAAPPAPVAAIPVPSMSAREIDMLDQLNAQRIAYGLDPVRYEPALLDVARLRATDMASRNYFSHTTPEGETIHDIMARYGLYYADSGEILARNNYGWDQTVTVSVQAFMNSYNHRSNILWPGYDCAAVGEALSASGIKYFAVVFSSAS